MTVSAVIFRLRFWIHALIFFLAFAAPWSRWLSMDRDGSTWLLLSTSFARNGWMSFTGATVAVLVLGTLLALAAALLRTWGSAYLGAATVHSWSMHGDAVMAAGPYRYVRNPLYLGIIVHTFALALLMPPSGAIFAIVAVTAMQFVLIAGEERFLSAKLGEPYRKYLGRVPRLLPSLRPKVEASEEQPNWRSGVLGEIYFWGVVAAFATVGWKYNASLITQGVLISLGVSLIVRGLMPRR
jgi:protein-S-isoprenylcysteine O-methyltransferase Ste14